MKSIKLTYILFICVLFLNNAFAAVYRVNNAGGINANFTDIQTAHDSASAGDTILVEGTTNAYSTTITLNKKLVILGPGYFLGQNPQTQANFSTALVSGTFNINSGSAGSVIMGLEFTYDVNINESNIIFKRNYSHATYSVNIGTSRSNVVIAQNYLVGPGSYAALTIASGCSNIIVTNNYLGNASSGFSLDMDPASSATIVNNIFSGKLDIHNSSFSNNIISSGALTGANNSLINSLCDATQLPAGSGNLLSTTMTTVFVGATGNSTDGQWKLLGGSPAIAAGASGEDCGIYGGSDPYVLSGMPPIPSIFFYSAPSSGSASQGLPVNIKIRANK